MSRSDSKIDLDKYKPSPEDVRRIADEEAAQERLRKALDNPSLDAAIAELHDRAPQPPRTSTPSPWAKEGSGGVDNAALPSAGRPVAPPVTAAIEGRRPGTQRWSQGNKALAAITLAFLPAMIVFILFVKPQQGAQQAVPSSTGAAPTAAASAAPTASASTTASAEPAATATSSAAATISAPAVAPQPPAAAPARPRPRGAIDDPYNGAPAVTVSPAATAAPSAAAAATTAQPSPPPPASATSAGSPFLRRRPE